MKKFENVTIGLNTGMLKRTFKIEFLKSCPISIRQGQMIDLFLADDK